MNQLQRVGQGRSAVACGVFGQPQGAPFDARRKRTWALGWPRHEYMFTCRQRGDQAGLQSPLMVSLRFRCPLPSAFIT